MAKLRNLLIIIVIASLYACSSGGGNEGGGQGVGIQVGDVVQVTLNIAKGVSENRPIRGYRVKINYDESKVSFDSVKPTPPTMILRQIDNGSEVIVGSIATTDIKPDPAATLLFNVNSPGLELSSFSVMVEDKEVNSVGGVVMTNTTSFSLLAAVQ